MTNLSVNINKFALLRNARGTNHPDLVEVAERCVNFGAQGITLHPRPDERHAKFSDLPLISKLVNSHSKVEFNIEGYPSERFITEVINTKPDQVTLVPDPPDALTSSFGWNCKEHNIFLKDEKKDVPCEMVLSKVKDVTTKGKTIQEKEAIYANNDVFGFNSEFTDIVRGKNIALIDDVVTTGVTARECLLALKNHVSNIYFYCPGTTKRKFGGY